MKKNVKALALVFALTAIVTVSGCISQPSIVTHHNSLEEAQGKCEVVCDDRVFKMPAKISECTDRECKCECGFI